MKLNKATIFDWTGCFFALAFLLAVFGCSSNATENSLSDKPRDGSAVQTSQMSVSTDSTAIPNDKLVQVYSQAIGDYIRLANHEYKLSFDTLFFGKHVFGQPDDFPAIELPATIENTVIRLVSPEDGVKKQKESKSSYYINLIGWVDTDSAEFVFVTFSNGMAHQFDGFINYKYNVNKKGFEMQNSRFQNYLYKGK